MDGAGCAPATVSQAGETGPSSNHQRGVGGHGDGDQSGSAGGGGRRLCHFASIYGLSGKNKLVTRQGGWPLCDYCDCRRIPQTARLGRQHEEVLEAFVDELHRHIAVEQYDLFPVAARLIPDQAWELVVTP